MVKRNLAGPIRNKPRAHPWNKEWCNGDENNPKTGAGKAIGNFIVARDARYSGIWWETQETPDTDTSCTTGSRRPDRRQIRQFKRKHIFVVIISSNSSSDRFQKTTAKYPCWTYLESVATGISKALTRSPTRTKQPAEPSTLDVPPQAKHPRRLADGRSECDSGLGRDTRNRG